MKRTNLVLREHLLEEATRLSGERTYSRTVERALEEFVRRAKARISLETLSEMVGTTRSRVNFFMNKFKRLGFIDYSGNLRAGIQVNSSLLSVVLHD